MNWTRIREHYAAKLREANELGRTQKEVADTGGIPGQNTISKLLRNNHLGPSVDTFVRAVHGLGLTVSAFFLELEAELANAAPEPRSATKAPVARRRRRSHVRRPVPQGDKESLSTIRAALEENLEDSLGALEQRLEERIAHEFTKFAAQLPTGAPSTGADAAPAPRRNRRKAGGRRQRVA